MKEYAILAYNNLQDITYTRISESLLEKTIQEYNSKYKYVFVYESQLINVYYKHSEEFICDYKWKFITSYTNK